MSVLSPSVIKELCQKYGLSPSKKYGQNYLISDSPIKKMLAAGELNKDDVVVEIGPGFGILTLSLAPLVKKVVAFEIEKKIKAYWDEKEKEFLNLEVVWGNALTEMKSHKSKVISLKSKGGSTYKVIANLPYQITSHVLRTLLELENKPERIIVMVQKEVADRICAKPNNMSILAVSVQYFGEPKIVTKVDRGNFWPQPKVDSAVLSINNIHKRSELNKKVNHFTDEQFFRVVRAGFASKRKQLWSNLNRVKFNKILTSDDIKNIVILATGNEKVRAEELSVEQWILICNNIYR